MRRHGTAASAAIAIAAAIAAAPALAQTTPPDDPLDLGIEEQVDVQLVLVDFLVLDRRERTVTDLALEDFVLVVNGKERRIAALDLDCPGGASDEPRPDDVSSPPQPLPPLAASSPRRIVLAFDYAHVRNSAETFDRVRSALDSRSRGGEELMVVSLGQVARIEMPWTRDLEEVRWTLERMGQDPELYARSHLGLTEHGFFERVEALMDLMELWPGRKSIVLFSGPFVADGFFHDPEFRDIGALSTATRTSIYPVDAAGVQLGTPLGGPAGLRRLANETGGRMTSGTNDIGLAYAKALRDMGCTYTMAFYESSDTFDRKRRMTIRIPNRSGLRIIYPEFYVVRSPETKRRSLFRTAAMLPEAFESSEVRTELVVTAPRSASRWRAVMGIEVRLDDTVHLEERQTWKLRGLLRRPNGTVMHSFRRDVPMPASRDAAPPVTLFEEVRVRPGRYLVTTILSDPAGGEPRAATRPAVVSPIPRGRPFLVGPVLGVPSETDPGGFRPLLDPRATVGEPLHSLTRVCVVDPDDGRSAGSRQLARSLESWETNHRREFPPVPLALEGTGAVRCHEQLDLLTARPLAPGRYELTAAVARTGFVSGSSSVEFTIHDGTPE